MNRIDPIQAHSLSSVRYTNWGLLALDQQTQVKWLKSQATNYIHLNAARWLVLVQLKDHKIPQGMRLPALSQLMKSFKGLLAEGGGGASELKFPTIELMADPTENLLNPINRIEIVTPAFNSYANLPGTILAWFLYKKRHGKLLNFRKYASANSSYAYLSPDSPIYKLEEL